MDIKSYYAKLRSKYITNDKGLTEREIFMAVFALLLLAGIASSGDFFTKQKQTLPERIKNSKQFKWLRTFWK